MGDTLALTVSGDFVDAIVQLVRQAVAEELHKVSITADPGYLDVDGAAEYLATTPGAVRALVKSRRIPVHRTPAGRLLFDRDELRAWVMSG